MGAFAPQWLLLAVLAAALIPLALGLTTTYLKMSIVLGMTRNALGTQQAPSSMVVLALALSLTLFAMGPVFEACLHRAETINIQAIIADPTFSKLTEAASMFIPWRDFLKAHSGVRELELLERREAENLSAQSGGPATSEPSLRVVVSAFVLTELKQGFSMGFVLLLPFLAIDLIVANLLVGLGMTMVSPVMIALPIKLMLFVASDGWLLLADGLIRSYRG